MNFMELLVHSNGAVGAVPAQLARAAWGPSMAITGKIDQ
jgi:hypothetical protein